MTEQPIVSAEGLTVHLGSTGGLLRPKRAPVLAVDGVDLAVRRGETFGLVGESGCGKTTLGRTLLGVQRETAGTIRLNGKVVSGLAPRTARQQRAAIQYVHQDPGAALDPWWNVGSTLREALKIGGRPEPDPEAAVDSVLEAVGLPVAVVRRYPHELSGGQLRRVGLARILILAPAFVILDEPTSGLDLSVQANVLRFFRETRERFDLTYVFISHDLSVVRLMCERVAIMYLGRIVETGPVKAIFDGPRHPYTRALIAAAPRLTTEPTAPADVVEGDPPSPANVPTGCRFRTRCPVAIDRCATTDPTLETIDGEHAVACIRWREIHSNPAAVKDAGSTVSAGGETRQGAF